MKAPPSDSPIVPDGETSRLTDYAADATGFGATELRTFRDLLMRPRTVLDAYLTHGPTGGHRYARALGLYVALNGILMFYAFLVGGIKGFIGQQDAAMLNAWIAHSGKSRDAFINDADSWMSLVVVPMGSIAYALFAVPLLTWWSGLDWRRSGRATFALLCAWTVPVIFLGPLPGMKGYALVSNLIMWTALLVAFLRMGRGLWWTNWAGGVGKALVLAFLLAIAAWASMIPSLYVGLLGGLWAQ